MSTKREASSKNARRKGALAAEEEKVLRMRHGLSVSPAQPLEQKGGGRPEVLAKLLEIEARAFEKSGRLKALRDAAGVEAQASAPVEKGKIISALKGKAGSTKTKAKAKVTAGAKSKKRR